MVSSRAKHNIWTTRHQRAYDGFERIGFEFENVKASPEIVIYQRLAYTLIERRGLQGSAMVRRCVEGGVLGIKEPSAS
ncbi:hypothetical protein M3J09_003926 [Ascochyta lentis]